MENNEKATELVGLIEKLIGIKEAVRGTAMAMIAEGVNLTDRYPGGVCDSRFLGELFQGKVAGFPVEAKEYFPAKDEVERLVQKGYLNGGLIKEKKKTEAGGVISGRIMKAYISYLCNRIKSLARQLNLRTDEKSLDCFSLDRLDHPDYDRLLELRDDAENIPSQKPNSPLDLKDPVACKYVAEIVDRQSGNVARALRSRNFPVVSSGRINYCEAEHAGILWPKFKQHWKRQKSS